MDYCDVYHNVRFTAVNHGFEAAAEPGLDARPSINTRMQQNTLVSMLSAVWVVNMYALTFHFNRKLQSSLFIVF